MNLLTLLLMPAPHTASAEALEDEDTAEEEAEDVKPAELLSLLYF